MPNYQVLVRRTVYENLYIHADNEEIAKVRAVEGDYYESEFLDAERTEICDVEQL